MSRAADMNDASSDIRARVRRVKALPTLPGVVRRLCSLVEDETTSANEIARIIATDQVLTAKVLRIVNSSFYGFPGRIGTINHALVLLGLNVVKGIVVSAAVVEFLTDKLGALWVHSLGVAVASAKLAKAVGAPEPEEISTAGLLHDFGKVVLGVELHAEWERVLQEAEWESLSFREAERRMLDGLDHCEIASWLAKEWALPKRLVEPITLHHVPHKAQEAPVPTAIVHLADILTRSLQFGSGGDPYVPAIHPAALDVLGLRLGDLVALLDLVHDELEDLDTSDFV